MTTIKNKAVIDAEKDMKLLSEKAQAIYANQSVYKFEKIGAGEYYCENDNYVYTLPMIEDLLIDFDAGRRKLQAIIDAVK